MAALVVPCSGGDYGRSSRVERDCVLLKVFGWRGVCVLKACWFWSYLSLSDDPPSSSPPEEDEEEDEDSKSSQQQGNKPEILVVLFQPEKFLSRLWHVVRRFSRYWRDFFLLTTVNSSSSWRREKNGMPVFSRFKWLFSLSFLCKNLILNEV